MGLPAVLSMICLMSISGCALVPGNYTYIEYVITQEKESASTGYILFHFQGSDTGIGEKTIQRGSPYEFTVSVRLAKRYSAPTLKNLIVAQGSKELLKIESKNLDFITDSATGFGENRFGYLNTDGEEISVGHEKFHIKCEVWAGDEFVAEGNFSFAIEKTVTRPNKFLDFISGM